MSVVDDSQTDAVQAAHTEQDLGPLAWVLDELRKSLEGASKAVGRFVPRPVLLQFGTNDKFIRNEDAKAMADAVSGPKTTFKTSDFEHELTYQAHVDRVAWLREQFRLPR